MRAVVLLVFVVPVVGCAPAGPKSALEVNEMLKSDDAKKQRVALDYVQQHGPETAAAVRLGLISALTSPDPVVRRAAVNSLGMLDPTIAVEVVPALTGALEDADAGVRQAAADRLAAFDLSAPSER